jgi:hypothetical protein
MLNYTRLSSNLQEGLVSRTSNATDRTSLKINFQRCLTKCQVPNDWCLTLDILCLTKNINAIE